MKKLKKILLINWLYFSKEVIEVGDVNFLTGKNGAGKSTVIDALQIVLLGETNARNFNLAANERSQRTLDGYLRADMDENNPYSRRGKDFSTYIVCEFEDDVEHNSFVCGVMFDCRSDGSKHDHFFIYVGKLPENCFIEDGEAMDIHDLRKFLKQNFSRAEVYDTQWEYRRNMLSRWNVHNEQVLRMMKKAVSFRPIVDIQQFITENICDIPDKPDIEAMQQNIRNYKRHEQLAQQQEEKLTALQEISTLYREMTRSVDRWRVQSFLVQWAQKEDMQAQIDSREQEKRNCLSELTAADTAIEDLAGQVQAKEERRRQRQGEEDLEGEAAAQDAFRLVVVPLAHGDGGPGGAAGGHQGGEGGDDEDHRHADAETRQGQVAVRRHVADVDPVHDVVEHVYDLGRHRGDGQPPQQRADGLRAQKGLVLIHVSFSFSGRPWARAARFASSTARQRWQMARSAGARPSVNRAVKSAWYCRPRRMMGQAFSVQRRRHFRRSPGTGDRVR